MSLRVAIGASTFGQKDPLPLHMLESHGIEVVPNPHGRRLTEDETIEHLREIDGLIAGLEPLTRRVQQAAAPRLKAIARVGIGVTNVDFDAAGELGIKVSNTPDPPARGVAELTLTAMLALCRRLVETNRRFHDGEWPKLIGSSLDGSSVLIVGYGRIGREVGRLLDAFGAEVLVNDPFVEPDSLTRGEGLVSLDEGLAEAEIVTLHAGGIDVVIGAEQFARMREGALLLNSARGELVDEAALIDALESGRVAGAWFDAFWQEPYNGPLLRYEQVLLTPHAGTYSRQCRLAMEVEAVENLLRDLGVTPEKEHSS